ncbi:MAG: hypothetical protein M0R80_26710 [Proteobacteria bacterium]|jgi:hypothetical protein|nr:hypothetical protein [Pseudomonadota bacterium]
MKQDPPLVETRGGRKDLKMKIGERTLGPQVRILVIPRQEGNVVFKAKAVLDYKAFDALVTNPVPPNIMMKGETSFKPNFKDPKYIESLDKYIGLKRDWMFIESLSVTPDLIWEKVKLEDIETWGKWSDELTEAGFTPMEINRIIGLIIEANGMDQTMIDEATKAFLAGQVVTQNV